MKFHTIERRRDPRTHAFVPITLRFHDTDDDTPAHMLDLSTGGAALLTTASQTPAIGDHVDLYFDRMNNENGEDQPRKRETAVIANVRSPEDGLWRIGVRFIEHPDIDCELLDPVDLLSSHRKGQSIHDPLRRWETARHFNALTPFQPRNRLQPTPV